MTAALLTPDELQRRSDLRRMKGFAGSLLIVAVITYALTRHHGGVLGFVNAGAEAAMVGGLADWFAVTALFRSPLGLPIPHTAIIPTRKDALGRSLESFVASNFLSSDVVRDKVMRARVSARVGTWLGDPAHAARVGNELATATRAAIRVLRDEDVTAVLETAILRRVAAIPWGPPLGRLLGAGRGGRYAPSARRPGRRRGARMAARQPRSRGQHRGGAGAGLVAEVPRRRRGGPRLPGSAALRAGGAGRPGPSDAARTGQPAGPRRRRTCAPTRTPSIGSSC